MGANKSKKTKADVSNKNSYNVPQNGILYPPGSYYQPQIYQPPAMILHQVPPPQTNFMPIYPLPRPRHYYPSGPRIIDESPIPYYD